MRSSAHHAGASAAIPGTKAARRLGRHGLTGRCKPRGRALVLVDIENLVGGSGARREDLEAARRFLEAGTQLQTDDHVIVGVGPSLLLVAAEAFPGARLLLGRGESGADRALISAVHPLDVAKRFSRVVIASGDHIFTAYADSCRRAGLAVWVITGRGALSRMLAAFADFIVSMPSTPCRATPTRRGRRGAPALRSAP